MGIGVGAAIPGVSGAAIAVIFRVYEDIIGAVNNFRKKFGYSIKVLIPILLGIICAVIPCIYLFSLAFEHLMFVLICLFAGFLLGSFPSITDKVKGVKPNKLQIALIITGGLFVVALGVLSVVFGDKLNIGGLFVNIKNNWWLYLVLIPVGVLAAVALTVPGLSGSPRRALRRAGYGHPRRGGLYHGAHRRAELNRNKRKSRGRPRLFLFGRRPPH